MSARTGRAFELARDLRLVRDGGPLVLALDGAHDRVVELARDLDINLDRADVILDRADVTARVVELALAIELARHRARGINIARAYGLTRQLVSTLTLDRAHARTYNLANRCSLELDRALMLHRDRADIRRDRAQRETGRVTYSAARLLKVIVQLLPAADRPRYAEEYRSELWELARTGAGRSGQLGYALRQLRSAPRTGRALRALRRRGAAQ